jgi:putative DNA primase/helicase
MTAQELLQANHIGVPNIAPGRYYTTCPQCSPKRSREHQNNKCLGVTIDDKGVHWGCNHCGWSGPEKGSGKASADAQTFYNYRDADGIVRFRKVRNPPGRTPKFYMQRPDGNGDWFNGIKGIDTSVLYRIDEVAKAIESGAVVCIVEGEKDADRLWSLGIAASCNAHGASEPGKQLKWTKAHSEQLKGANIVVLNDNDAAGYAHADAAAKLSLGIAKRVRRLDLAKHWPEMPKGNDVSDWLDGGRSGQQLIELMDSAPDYTLERDPGAGAIDDDAELERLARMAPLDYERARKDASKRLGISRLSLLDALVKAKRAELGLDGDDGKQGHAITFAEVNPWPDAVDGAALLNALADAIGRYVVMTEHTRHACALWVVHSYLLDQFMISPRLAVRSPVKGCGKTTLLDVLACLVPRPLSAANVSPSAIFRVIEGYRPTLLIDEADTLFGEGDDALRGVLNSGHRRGGAVLRTVGDDHEPRAFATYAATSIALIGALPGTLADRSIDISLARRKPDEKIEPFRLDRTDGLDALARQCARWARDHGERVGAIDPPIPAGLYNRAADNWCPLLAIAEAVGGPWPQRVCTAALKSVGGEVDEISRLELLLGDIRDIFGKLKLGTISSAELIEKLVEIMPRPWGEYGRSGKPLTQNKLARLLKPLGIAPGLVGTDRVSGYHRWQFEEAFGRYLRPKGDSNLSHSPNADSIGTSGLSQTSHPKTGREDWKCEKSNNDGLMRGGEVAKGGDGKKALISDVTDVTVVTLPAGNGGAERHPLVCEHCGAPEQPGNTVQRCAVDGLTYLLHRHCQNEWMDA